MNLAREFWEKAYRENAPKIIGICRRYVSDKEIAEDLMHDAFLTAINKYSSYKGKGHFNAWLRKIAVNTALMYLRSRNSKKTIKDWAINESEYENMNESKTENTRRTIENADFSEKELLEIIDCLPEHHKLVFNLYVIDNYTHVKIGKELNISPGTSKSHLARARKKLQQLLYQKALEKPFEQRKKKRAGLLLLFLPFKSLYIDRLFKDRLANYSIEPASKSIKLLDSVNWDTIALPVLKPYAFITKLKYWLIGSLCGIMVIFITIYVKRNNFTLPVNQEVNSNITDSFNSLIGPADSANTTEKNDTTAKDKLVNKEQNNLPVIIKKTTIQRKTVIIRDTIKIIDSSNVQ